MTDDFIPRMEAALPIDDIVGWIVREHPSATEPEVMGMVQQVYQRDYDIRPASSTIQTYRVGDTTWDACPQRVALSTPAS